MKLKLNLQERLIFLQLLPRENNLSTLKIIRKVSDDIGITEEEYKEYKMKPLEDGRVSFDPVKSQIEKEFEIGEIVHQLIKVALEKLDQDRKLTQEHVPIYDKIFEISKEEDK